MAAGDPRSAERHKAVEILTGSGGAAQKLPILREAFAELADELTDDFRASRGSSLEIKLTGVDIGKAGDQLSTYAESIAGASIRAVQWEASLLAGVDRGFVFAFIDAMFGGDGGEPPFTADRPLTVIETEIVTWMFTRVIAAMESSFREIAGTSFIIESTDCPPVFDSIGSPSNPIVAASFELQCAGGKGTLFIAMPQSALAFLRIPPARSAAKQPPSSDPAWTGQLGKQLGRADIGMRAVLGASELTLAEVASLHPGKIITLEPVSENRVRLECNGQPLFWCKLGQSQGVYTLSLEDAIDHEQEFMDDILSH
jgi:flagellar motor switch protein FliM